MRFQEDKNAEKLGIDTSYPFRVVSNKDNDEDVEVGDIIYFIRDDDSVCPEFSKNKHAKSEGPETFYYYWKELEYANEPVDFNISPFYVVFNHAYEILHRFKTEKEVKVYIAESEEADLSIFEVNRELSVVKPKELNLETKKEIDWE